MAKKNKKPNLAQKNWRPTPKDFKLLDELKAKMGVRNETDLVRMGLRKLAEAEGLR